MTLEEKIKSLPDGMPLGYCLLNQYDPTLHSHPPIHFDLTTDDLKRMRDTLQTLLSAYHGEVITGEDAEAAGFALARKHERMVEALEKYADESNWYQQTSEIDGSSLDDFDAFYCEGNGFDIAQNALK